jgi:hypothetical protein
MRRREFLAAAGVGMAPLFGLGRACAADKGAADHKCGTTIDFLDTPSEAARKAKKEEKLVFVLHVSGTFEDPRFT